MKAVDVEHHHCYSQTGRDLLESVLPPCRYVDVAHTLTAVHVFRSLHMSDLTSRGTSHIQILCAFRKFAVFGVFFC